MKKLMVLCSVFLFAFGSAGVAGAVTITYDYSHSSDEILTTPYDWATVETFDNGSLLWTWTGSGAIVTGALINRYAAPYNNSIMGAADQTNYVTVPDPDSAGSGSYTTDLGGTYNYFGIFWDRWIPIIRFHFSIMVASYPPMMVSQLQPRMRQMAISQPPAQIYTLTFSIYLILIAL